MFARFAFFAVGLAVLFAAFDLGLVPGGALGVTGAGLLLESLGPLDGKTLQRLAATCLIVAVAGLAFGLASREEAGLPGTVVLVTAGPASIPLFMIGAFINKVREWRA